MPVKYSSPKDYGSTFWKLSIDVSWEMSFPRPS